MRLLFSSQQLFLILAIHLLRSQLISWPIHTRWSLRFLVAFVFSVFTAIFANVIAELPKGWFDTLLSNLPTPQGIFITTVVLTLSLSSFGFSILTAKAIRTL